MNIHPLYDHVVVIRMEAEHQTASGVVIPDKATEKPDQVKAIAVGTGRVLADGKRLNLDVKIGDRVLFGKYAGQTVKVHDEELLVMREDDIMAVMED